jgi:glycosyltransferase involved in cell wall biosynthesis
MFEFLKYIQPLWYYRLAFQSENSVLLDELYYQNSLETLGDERFSSKEAQKMDSVYRALQLGVILFEKTSFNKKEKIKTIANRNDNYLFVAKYFGKFKLVYVLFLRIMALNNPILELIGFVKALKITKIDVTLGHCVYKEFESFQSPIIQSNPLVTVVIPTLNRYQYLKVVLENLEAQNYQNFELIICDQTDVIQEDFYKGWNLNIRLIEQEEKALWLARNRSIQQSIGDIILLTEDDVLLPINWITNHLKCLDFFKCDISAGVFFPEGKLIAKNQSYFKFADHLATGNVCFRKHVFEKIGLFDRQFEKQRMGDGEFGLRAMLNGLKSVSNPYSYCIDIKASTGGLRQMGSWDSLRPTKLFAPRPVPSVLYLARKYFGNTAAKFYLIQNIPFSFIPYKFKKSKYLKLAFLIILPLLIPLMLIVVIKSWSKASQMLNDGAKIPQFTV